jgi:hypothetical protein
MVDDANPASPSRKRTTLASMRGWRCAVMNASTSCAVTSWGSLSTSVKNTRRSDVAASSVLRRARASTNSR